MANQRVERALQSMRSPDPALRAQGFDFLREHADAYVDEIVEAFREERDDELRCLLLELITEARSPGALTVLADQLDSDDESLRFWAIRGLEMLDSAEARQALHRGRVNGWIA
ncbi:HEAT repeat domain-containing protein [Actinoallomurus purpureus]|uniref:HEAT repeat domain-containing protein n=1 Tax=Actinoallomurus purpureus TaxID=478114 RepID=UPI002092161E|nr:HEAT repeat domain-containing protein [Actinoallomurus purpureus]MCO6010939.1 HEAT repeat domain-containing protein [Actinoallomurus purpureus]